MENGDDLQAVIAYPVEDAVGESLDRGTDLPHEKWALQRGTTTTFLE
jgi:hypothetical protein